MCVHLRLCEPSRALTHNHVTDARATVFFFCATVADPYVILETNSGASAMTKGDVAPRAEAISLLACRGPNHPHSHRARGRCPLIWQSSIAHSTQSGTRCCS